jgi:hypothetical protein
MIEDYKHITSLALQDVKVLEEKGKTYGSSWRNRGGIGAFMMLARKWDRLENQCKANGYDIFVAIDKDINTAKIDGILDDIADLRRYLLLVEAHLTSPKCANEIYAPQPVWNRPLAAEKEWDLSEVPAPQPTTLMTESEEAWQKYVASKAQPQKPAPYNTPGD